MIKHNYKKALIILFAFGLNSCNSLSKFSSAKTIDVKSSIEQKPVIVDLTIKENKVTGTSSNKIMFGLENVKQEAVSNAIKSANADILVEPKFEIIITKSTITATVTGYPASYKNFRAMKTEDLILLESLYPKKDQVNSNGLTPNVLNRNGN